MSGGGPLWFVSPPPPIGGDTSRSGGDDFMVGRGVRWFDFGRGWVAFLFVQGQILIV